MIQTERALLEPEEAEPAPSLPLPVSSGAPGPGGAEAEGGVGHARLPGQGGGAVLLEAGHNSSHLGAGQLRVYGEPHTAAAGAQR